MSLACLYWMTIEFSLVETDQDKRIYGGGIPPPSEGTAYCPPDKPLHQAFNPLEAMHIPYRVDILQPLYLVLPDLKHLFQLVQEDIMALIHEAVRPGLYAPLFPPKRTT